MAGKERATLIRLSELNELQKIVSDMMFAKGWWHASFGHLNVGDNHEQASKALQKAQQEYNDWMEKHTP